MSSIPVPPQTPSALLSEALAGFRSDYRYLEAILTVARQRVTQPVTDRRRRLAVAPDPQDREAG